MRTNQRSRIVTVALVLMVSACSGTAAETTTTTAAPTTTITTTTTTSTTTTTETPGPPAELLAHAFTDDLHLDYAVVMGIEMDLETSGLFSLDGTGAEFASIGFDFEGRRRLLVLPAVGDGFEIVFDFVPESGSVSWTTGTTEFSLEMEREELIGFNSLGQPMVVDPAGAPADGRDGTPAAYLSGIDVFTLLALLGPPLSTDPVEVGDSWTSTIEDPLVGEMEITAEIAGEEDLEDGRVLVIEFTGTAGELPLGWDFSEVYGQFSEEFRFAGFVELVDALARIGAGGTITISNGELSGTMRFEPDRGVVASIETTTAMGLSVSVTTEGLGSQVEMEMTVQEGLTLIKANKATWLQKDAILTLFEADPYDLAAQALGPITATWPRGPAMTDQQYAGLFDPFDAIGWDWMGGVSAGTFIDVEGNDVMAVAFTTTGEFRGVPDFTEGLLGQLSGRNPVGVPIGEGAVAYRATVGGDEWLMWNNETHLYLLVGRRDLATEMMGILAVASDPYIWQEGDCLDLRNGGIHVWPNAPYGKLGLVHCAAGHTHEVLSSEAPQSGPDEDHHDIVWIERPNACDAALASFSGLPDLETALDTLRYAPSEAEWNAGSRYGVCLVYLSGSSGLVPVQGSLGGRGPDHPITLEEGVCLNDTIPVPCFAWHTAEVFAVLEHEAEAGAGFPGDEEYGKAVGDACKAAFDEWEVTGGSGEVGPWWLSDAPVGWEDGERTYYCVASVHHSEHGYPLHVVGSFTGEWAEVETGP